MLDNAGVIDELIGRAAADDDDAIEELTEIADAEPERLRPYLGRMLDAGVLWPGTMYRAAGADVVARVVALVDAGEEPELIGRCLFVLAHSRHQLAYEAMRRWMDRPPPGADLLHVGMPEYAQEGGWTIDPDGSRRELCGDVAHEWQPREAPAPQFNPECPWCSSPLWTAADLDGSEPALAHTGWAGRLRFRTCFYCSCYTTLFSEVTPDGGSTWWAGNTRPSFLQVNSRPEEPPSLLPVVGRARSNPFRAGAWSAGGSTLGGHPQWIQDAEHPACPGCGLVMNYVGLIGGADLYEFGEGAYYLHVHASCGFAAVTYQQS
ncbi:hypothetical protein Acy02nite_00200 [Actinoplanes cyaneus]|uniref:DUF1963 domain-containing protein n=1 Tax=Actinoplanes cyaneus TaxID=52696 RepID=A0A919IAF4_9ACTN|nr:hypothetical protein [Actinoplanes cyaneus]GID62139.1 hypothetical protein Acy02nite_00200 [Actinoplanes cyaneus]